MRYSSRPPVIAGSPWSDGLSVQDMIANGVTASRFLIEPSMTTSCNRVPRGAYTREPHGILLLISLVLKV